MSNRKKHRDRGDGACATCFEEWPCAISQGAHESLLDADERSARLAESLRRSEEESAARNKLISLINERLEQLDIKENGRALRVPHYCNGFMLRVETMADLLRRIPIEED